MSDTPQPPEDQVIFESQAGPRPIPDHTAKLMRWSLIYLVVGILTMWGLTMSNYYLTNQDQRYEAIATQLQELRSKVDQRVEVEIPKIDIEPQLEALKKDILDLQQIAIDHMTKLHAQRLSDELEGVRKQILLLTATLKSIEARVTRVAEAQDKKLDVITKRLGDQEKTAKAAAEGWQKEVVVLKNGIKGQQLIADSLEKRLTTLTKKLQEELKLFLPPPAKR